MELPEHRRQSLAVLIHMLETMSRVNVDDGSCSGYPDNGDYSLSFDGSMDVSISEKNINGIFEEFSFSSWVNVHDFGEDYNPEYLFDVGRNAELSVLHLVLIKMALLVSLME